MFSLTSSHRYFLYREPTDMRKSFDALAGLVARQGYQATDGGVYVFINKRCDRIKLLHWEEGGFVLYYKRLEAGVFERPKHSSSGWQIDWQTLMLMVQGVKLASVKKMKRYVKKA